MATWTIFAGKRTFGVVAEVAAHGLQPFEPDKAAVAQCLPHQWRKAFAHAAFWRTTTQHELGNPNNAGGATELAYYSIRFTRKGHSAQVFARRAA